MSVRDIAAIAGLLAALAFQSPGTEAGSARIPLRSDGTIPAWYVAGPFEQPTAGFGDPVDSDMIGEKTVSPYEGKPEASTMCAGGTASWHGQAADEQGYLDFARTIGWTLPGENPEKVWIAKVGYAFTQIDVPAEHDALLLLGSNSSLRVFLNGSALHTYSGQRGAVPNQDTVRLHLQRGKNTLLLKVGNTHQNYWLNFFGGAPWGWGAYARIVGTDGTPLRDLHAILDRTRQEPGLAIVSTFFFKNSARGLRQRFDLSVDSPWPDTRSVALRVER
ncbi:hypothetical protein EHM92_08525, partial [bacterium]